MRLVKLNKTERALADAGYKLVPNTRKDKGIKKPMSKQARKNISNGMKKMHADRHATH